MQPLSQPFSGSESAWDTAQNPETTADVLRELASHPDARIRAAVARHANTPTDVLLSLGAEFPAQLIANPAFSLPLLLLERPDLEKHLPKTTLNSLLQQDDLPLSFLEWVAPHFLASQWGEEVGMRIVRHVHCTPLMLEQVIDGMVMPHRWSQELGMAILQHPAINEDLLYRLANQSESDRVLVAIATHPLTSQRVLERLAKKGYRRLLAVHLVRQLDAPACVLDPLAEHIPFLVVLHPNTSGSTLSHVVLNSSHLHQEETRCMAIRHPHFPAAALEQLVLDPQQYRVSKEMRLAIANHPNTPLPVLKQLVNDPHPFSINLPYQHGLVVEAVASRSDLPLPMVVLLLKSLGSQKLLKNRHIHPEILAELADHPDISIRCAVAEHPNTPATILEQWTTHPRLSRALAANPQVSPAILEPLMEREELHLILAGNPRMPGHLLRSLVLRWHEPNHSDLLRLVAEHPHTPTDTLALLAFQEPERVARHPNAPVELLRKWAQSEHLLWSFIAENPQAPTDLLFQLKQLSHDRYEVNDALASNPRSPDCLLEQLLDQHGGTVVYRPHLSDRLLKKLVNAANDTHRIALAQNPHIPLEYLQQLAADPYFSVRGYVIQNPSTPIALLQELASHPDPHTQDRALRQFLLRSTIEKSQLSHSVA